ncbi:MAG: hypothetical protein IPH18_06000 [Chitinophagaceae bacterium]|nr:hypothetical protein [Chitinophagaceae bacterium]
MKNHYLFRMLAVGIIVTAFFIFKQTGVGIKNRRRTPSKKRGGVDKQLSLWFQARAYPDPNFLNEKYQRLGAVSAIQK